MAELFGNKNIFTVFNFIMFFSHMWTLVIVDEGQTRYILIEICETMLQLPLYIVKKLHGYIVGIFLKKVDSEHDA